MDTKPSPLDKLLEKLNALEQEFLNCAKDVFQSGNNYAYEHDYIALSVLNRAIALNRAYLLLVQNQNTLTAVNQIRLQLDNLIRYNAIFLFENPGNFIRHVLNGNPINKYSFRKHKLSDTFLAQELDKECAGIFELYKHLCEYIHFSHKHFERIQAPTKNGRAVCRVSVGNFDIFSEEEKIEYTKNLLFISEIILQKIRLWPIKKGQLFDFYREGLLEVEDHLDPDSNVIDQSQDKNSFYEDQLTT